MQVTFCSCQTKFSIRLVFGKHRGLCGIMPFFVIVLYWWIKERQALSTRVYYNRIFTNVQKLPRELPAINVVRIFDSIVKLGPWGGWLSFCKCAIRWRKAQWRWLMKIASRVTMLPYTTLKHLMLVRLRYKKYMYIIQKDTFYPLDHPSCQLTHCGFSIASFAFAPADVAFHFVELRCSHNRRRYQPHRRHYSLCKFRSQNSTFASFDTNQSDWLGSSNGRDCTHSRLSSSRTLRHNRNWNFCHAFWIICDRVWVTVTAFRNFGCARISGLHFLCCWVHPSLLPHQNWALYRRTWFPCTLLADDCHVHHLLVYWPWWLLLIW